MTDRRTGAAAAAVAAVGLVANTVDAIRLPLWWDEVASARAFTQPSAAAVLGRVTSTEATPPGWYLAAFAFHWALSALGAPSVTPVRAISVLAVSATGGLVVVAGARTLPLWAAVVAGLTFILAYQALAHGSELRAYGLLMLLALGFALQLESAVARPSRGRLVGLGVVTALGLYTHYVFVCVVLAAVPWAAVATTGRTRTRVLFAIAAGGVPLLVWLPSAVTQSHEHQHTFLGTFRVGEVASTYANLLAAAPAWAKTAPSPLPASTAPARLIVSAVVMLGVAMLARRGASLYATLALLPLVVAAALWIAGIRIFDTRNLVVLLPFVALAIAAAAAAVPSRRLARLAGVACVLAIGGAALADGSLGRTAYDQIAAGVSRAGWTGSQPLVVFSNRYPVPLSWYLPGRPLLARARLTNCTRLVVVSESAAGARWLRAHASDVGSLHGYPSYGHQAFSPRIGSASVAVIRPTAALLRDLNRRGVAWGPPRAPGNCYRPIPGTTASY